MNYTHISNIVVFLKYNYFISIQQKIIIISAPSFPSPLKKFILHHYTNYVIVKLRINIFLKMLPYDIFKWYLDVMKLTVSNVCVVWNIGL